MAGTLASRLRRTAATGISGLAPERRELLVGRLLTPEVGFPLLWLLGVGLAQIRLFNFQEHGNWSLRVWAVMALVPIAFLCGCAVGRAGADLVRERVRAPQEASLREWRRVSLVLLAIGTLEALHQLLLTGNVPLFQEDIDRSRVALTGGPTVVLANCAPLAAAVALAGPRRLDPRVCRLEFAVAIAGLTVVTLLGGRGQVVLGIAVLVLLRAYRFGPPSLRFLGAAFGVVALFIAVVFFVRSSQNVANPFEGELYSEVLPGIPAPLRVLVPLHVAIASNFEALAQVVGFIPDRLAYGHGAYSAYGFDLVIPNSKHVGDVSAQLTPPFTTSTVAGSFWADGGFLVVAFGLATIGAMASGVRRLATSTGALRFALPGAYLTYLCFFGIYQNLFTQHPDWVVITPVLFAAGAWLDGWRPRSVRDHFAYRVRRARRGATQMSAAALGKRGRLLTAIGAVVVVILAAALIGSTLGDDPGSAAGGRVNGQPAGTIPATADQLISSGDGLLDNDPLWAVQRRASSVTLTKYQIDAQKRFRKGSDLRFPVRVPRSARLDVASWVGEAEALFAMRPTQQGVGVQVYGATAGRLLRAGRAEEPSLFDGGTRDVAIATFSGQLPDLYIIDRGVPAERARLAIYSGESAFRSRLVSIRLPVVGLSARDWSLDVGGVAPGPPDLILIVRRGQSEKPEVHVLAGRAGYRAFKIQQTVGRYSPSGQPALRAITVAGAPVAAAIDARGRSPVGVTLLNLGPPAGG